MQLLVIHLLAACLTSSSQSALLTASLEPVERYYQKGRTARVRLTLNNESASPIALAGTVLFGSGLKINRVNGSDIPVAPAPPQSTGEFLIPARATLSVVLDLCDIAPAALDAPGKLELLFQHPAAENCYLPINVWKDYTGLRAVIETDFGEMELEFEFENAPHTVKNFLDLAERGFYDGLVFHRVVQEFMIQGGCPLGDGTGNSDYIPFEESGISHDRGVISMARREDPDSGSCQFFLITQDSHFLNGYYASFGRLIRGLETLDKIAAVECVMSPNSIDEKPSSPKEKVYIRKIRAHKPAPKEESEK